MTPACKDCDPGLSPPRTYPRATLHRAVHQRTRDLDWLEEREHAESVPCPPRPRGCGLPARSTCRDRHGTELVNQTAHLARIARADNPPPPAAAMPALDPPPGQRALPPAAPAPPAPVVDDVPWPDEPTDDPYPDEDPF